MWTQLQAFSFRLNVHFFSMRSMDGVFFPLYLKIIKFVWVLSLKVDKYFLKKGNKAKICFPIRTSKFDGELSCGPKVSKLHFYRITSRFLGTFCFSSRQESALRSSSCLKHRAHVTSGRPSASNPSFVLTNCWETEASAGTSGLLGNLFIHRSRLFDQRILQLRKGALWCSSACESACKHSFHRPTLSHFRFLFQSTTMQQRVTIKLQLHFATLHIKSFIWEIFRRKSSLSYIYLFFNILLNRSESIFLWLNTQKHN